MKRKRQSEHSTPNKKAKSSNNKPSKARGLAASMLHICNVPENILWSIIEDFGCVKEINNFRLVCKQFVRATNMTVPCFAFIQTLIEDSKKYEANESQWITPLELEPLYLFDGKSMPSPTDAPLLALQAIIEARLKNDRILYLVPQKSCALETSVSLDEETHKTILIQSFMLGASLFAMTQTDDKALQEFLDVTDDKPFILSRKNEAHSELIDEICEHMEFEDYVNQLKRKQVTVEPIFNANQFHRADALQKLPKLPASVFKLLMKKGLSETDELNLKMLLRAIEMLRWNVIYKFYQQEKLTKSDLLDLSTEDIRTLYDKLVITKVEFDGQKHPELHFRFKDIDGDFHIRNKGNYRNDPKEFTLTFNTPVHYDCTSYLHLQHQLGFKNFLIASDFVDLLYKAVGGKKTKEEQNNTERKDPRLWMKQIDEVDPSCQVSDCRLEQSTLMCHHSRFYCLLQILTRHNSENDEQEFYCHVRFGKETKAMIYPHFIATIPRSNLKEATNSFNYWINALKAERFFELWCEGIEILPWLYCASLKSMTKEILATSDKERLKKLDQQLPDNQIVEYAKLNMKLLHNQLKPSHVTKRLKIDYSNFYLWQLKVKLFEKNKDIDNAARCLEIALDMLEDETKDIHEKLYFRNNFMKKYNKLNLKKHKSLSPEEALMLFIYHPESVAKAKKFREKSKEFDFGLDLLEQAQGDSNAYLYPIEEITASIQKTRKFAILSVEDELVKEIVHRDGFYMPDHFYRAEYGAKTTPTASVFWYFTHPMNIPSILQNGINIRQGTAAYFYARFMNYQIAEHQFGVEPFCVTTKNGNKFYAALLVEVDISNSKFSHSMPQMPFQYPDEDQFCPCIQVGPSSVHFRTKLGDGPTTTLEFETSDTNLVMVLDPSRIGAVRYFGIVLKQDNSLNKFLNVSLRADYFKTSSGQDEFEVESVI